MRRNAISFLLITAGLALALCGGAAAQDGGGDGFERPKYNYTLRFREDWSVLAGVPRDDLTDFWDPIKYVPLSEDGSIWASFGGSTRFRLESWWNFNFLPSSTGDDTFLLWRARVHGDFHFGENVRVFVEGKSALSTDRSLPGGKRTLDVDTLALQQAFVDVRIPIGTEATFTFRPGRQQYLFGKQRLVSPLPWSNTMRAWDGLTGILEWGDWRIEGFWSQFAPVQKYDFNDADPDIQLYGVYSTGRVPAADMGLDLYFLGLTNKLPRTYNGTTGPEDRYTLGSRVHGALADTGFDYDFEGAYQFGRVGPGDVSAWMIGSQFGYRVPAWWAAPRFYVGFDYGSGDQSAGGDVETFNQLLPLAHAFLGHIDQVGRQNVIDPNLGVTFAPLERLKIDLAVHFLFRETTADALYNAGGAVVRPGALGTSTELGQEIDLTVTYKFDRHTTGQLGYSHFFAGDFIGETGPANDIDFLYLQLTYTF